MKVFTILVTVLLAGILIVCNDSGKTNLQSETKTSYIDSVYSADSVSIKYEVSGMGDKSLVFVHCWCCDRSYFENQIGFLSRDYKVVAIDLAGYGSSGMNCDEWTVSAYANDVAAVVNKLGLKDVVLIGHSMGGMVVM